jgi:hypothetical protein
VFVVVELFLYYHVPYDYCKLPGCCTYGRYPPFSKVDALKKSDKGVSFKLPIALAAYYSQGWHMEATTYVSIAFL